MIEVVDYDLFQKMKALDNRQDLDGNDFGRNTCCDYLDSLVQDGEKFGVVMFVEPCGNITKWGKSWSEVLDWWIEVFKHQPENWQYAESGWYLMSMSEKGFSDDPTKVFPLTIEAKQILETIEREIEEICKCGHEKAQHDNDGVCFHIVESGIGMGDIYCDCFKYAPIPALLPNDNNPSTAPETAQGGGVMFSYYGSKSKVVDAYPSPKFGKIIEPFAGSARYSLKYFDRDVLLVDKYPVIVDLWKWLQQASEADIIGLPNLYRGQSVDGLDIPVQAKHLIGFCINQGSAQPKKTAQDFNGWNETKKQIAKNLFKIKHWVIRLGSHDEPENVEATWFIDPPYQFGGEWYVKNNKSINFPELGRWCEARKGQVIVCENTKADWLPFYPMREMTGAYSATTEAIWSNMPHDYMARQPPLL